MDFTKVLRYIFSLAVAVAVGYFFYLEFKKNSDAISASHFTANHYYISERIYFEYTQMFDLFVYMLLGIAMYFLAKGMSMEIPFSNIFAIMATISVTAIISSFAFFTIRGLGVREGAIFLMIRQFSSMETALILPIATRLLLIVVELFMGIIALIIGLGYGYFSGLSKNRQKEFTVEKAKADADL